MKKFLLSICLSLGTSFAAETPEAAVTLRVEKSTKKEGRHELVIVNRSDRNFSCTGYDYPKRTDPPRCCVHYSTQLVYWGKWKDGTPQWRPEDTVPLDLPGGQTLRQEFEQPTGSESPSPFRLTVRLQEGTAKDWKPEAKGIVIASPMYLRDGTTYREVIWGETGAIPPEAYKGVAPSWKRLRSIRDAVNVASVLEHAGRGKAPLDAFMTLFPPRYPKSKVMVFPADSMVGASGFGRPPVSPRWNAKVSIIEGKPAILESIRETYHPAGAEPAKLERIAEVPEIDATLSVWYLYSQEDAVDGSWPLEADPPPLHVQTISFSYDLSGLRESAHDLKGLVLAAPPPRFPVTGYIGWYGPRIMPTSFDLIIRDGRYEVDSDRGTQGDSFSYTWRNPFPALPEDR
ncbi:hypothetical protein [Luteolibacter soli]|uniref:Uncharacterized protein n=1 Tax=Luteolibacter soli TaxID=3135280 RepID=A0ABU9APM8_9BACT